MPTPSTTPTMPSTTQAVAARSARLSQPRETSHQTMHANSAIIRPTPRPPSALNVERTKNSHAPSSTRPTIALAGVIDGKPSASQWKYEVPDGLKVRYTSAIENATRHAMPSRLNLPIVSPCPR